MTILQLRTSKAQIITNTRALIYLGLDGSVTELIKHETSDILPYPEKSSTPVRGRFVLRS